MTRALKSRARALRLSMLAAFSAAFAAVFVASPAQAFLLKRATDIGYTAEVGGSMVGSFSTITEALNYLCIHNGFPIGAYPDYVTQREENAAGDLWNTGGNGTHADVNGVRCGNNVPMVNPTRMQGVVSTCEAPWAKVPGTTNFECRLDCPVGTTQVNAAGMPSSTSPGAACFDANNKSVFGKADPNLVASPKIGNCGRNNPCNPATGMKTQTEHVYSASHAVFPLRLSLQYRSRRIDDPFDLWRGNFGTGWTSTFDRRVKFYDPTFNPSLAVHSYGVKRPDGRELEFKVPASGHVFDKTADIADTLVRLVDTGGALIGWRYTAAEEDEVETYDAAGLLLYITNRAGVTHQLTYSHATDPKNDTNEGRYPVDAPICVLPHPTYSTGWVIGKKKLLCVTDSLGRQLHFRHDEKESRIVAMLVAGDTEYQLYQFQYDGVLGGCQPPGVSPFCKAQNLTQITFPDGKSRQLHYNEAAYINLGAACSGTPLLLNSLTGITDENTDRFSTYKYDCTGRAVSTERGSGLEKATFTYDGATTTVTDHVGDPLSPTLVSRKYSFDKKHLVPRTAAIVDPANNNPAPCGGCGGFASMAYDDNGNVESRTDWKGNVTTFEYDLTRNLETKRIEGFGTSVARTISTQWHPTFRLPMAIAEPLRVTKYAYNGDPGASCGLKSDSPPVLVPGVPCSKEIWATADLNGSQGFNVALVGTPRTWKYKYNPHGKVLEVNGPRPESDASDVTTYTYHDDSDPPAMRGNLKSIENVVGQIIHTTQISAYNAHGQPATIVDPNGLSTELEYYPRQWLKKRTVGGEMTQYEYYDAGPLKKVTLPNNETFLFYEYDHAHRLTAITDNLDNRIAYTLDAMGNRTVEQVREGTTVRQIRSRVFDSLNRLSQDIGAIGQTTQYAYDAQGNLTRKTMPFVSPTDSITTRSYDYDSYDALNRLRNVTEPPKAAGITRGTIAYDYDLLDQLTQVTDPRGLPTTYAIDGLGNLNLQTSPDTGTTTNNIVPYDAAGNLRLKRDAKNQDTTYTYDALNRVSVITFADQTKHEYVYDQGAFAKGRLSSITEKNAANHMVRQTAYAYNQHGRVTSESRNVAGVQHLVGYAYDSFGRLSGITYPGGRTVTYSFDALGRVNQISTTKRGLTRTLVQDITYHPFGGVKTFTMGNGQNYERRYDTDGRIDRYSLGAQLYPITYDAAGRISFLGDNVYDYDKLDRLTLAIATPVTYTYDHDAVGNRTSRSVPAESIAPRANSNQIDFITPVSGPTRTFTHDANGSTTADGGNTYCYDARGRMVKALGGVVAADCSDPGATTFEVNALGQRVRKTSPLGDTVFHYDMQGRLIAETSPSGPIVREYMYLGDIPVAVALPVTTLGGWIIVDNMDAGFSFSGNWDLGTLQPGYYGTNYRSKTGNSSVTGTATWALQVPTTASYSVFAWWSSDSNRATNAKYTVNHAGGATEVTVNQQQNGSQWNLLGTFALNQGSAHSVTLTNLANGRVAADAVLITSGAQLPSPPLPSVDINAAADAFTRSTSPSTNFGTQDTIELREGTSQKWGHIRFNFSKVLGEVTSATLAIRLEEGPSSGTTTLSVYPVTDTTWGETTINWSNQPAVGAAAVGSATIQGTTTPQWYELDITAYVQTELALGHNVISLALKVTGGEWEFASREQTGRPRVRIQAVHPSYYYVHTDHLNTPRLVADATGTPVWRWDQQEPFGVNPPDENPSGLGVFEQPLRFPGQYFDKETNLFYNYFRDYDPGIGRYPQSDPIGLQGGLNSYAYADGDPIRNFDPNGLASSVVGRLTIALWGASLD